MGQSPPVADRLTDVGASLNSSEDNSAGHSPPIESQKDSSEFVVPTPSSATDSGPVGMQMDSALAVPTAILTGSQSGDEPDGQMGDEIEIEVLEPAVVQMGSSEWQEEEGGDEAHFTDTDPVYDLGIGYPDYSVVLGGASSVSVVGYWGIVGLMAFAIGCVMV